MMPHREGRARAPDGRRGPGLSYRRWGRLRGVRIRPAVPSDVPVLLAIEAAADALFAGIGMAAAAWAVGRDLRAMTLTTFADVPWNAPYYRRLGFREMSGAEIGPELRGIIRHEAEQGLAPWPRVAMIREIRTGVEA